MNRFIIPIASTALAAGIAVPSYFGRHTIERVVTEPVQTVVREIYHETPVVYTDTVYMAEEQAPVQPVYVEEHNDYEYNQYNQYNHTDIDVHQRVVIPPQRREPRWSPRDRGQQPRDRSGYDKPRERRNSPPSLEKPTVPVPKLPAKRKYTQVTDNRQKSPDRPTQPAQSKRQVPAHGGGTPAAQVKVEAPKHSPTPVVDNPVVPTPGEVQVGMVQARRK